jgi:dipeptide transport system ATP-binding protein
MALLEIKQLSVEFSGFRAVDQLDLTIAEGEVVGIVGESGSGKSVGQLAVMGLIPYPGRIAARRMHFNGCDLSQMPPKRRRRLLGKDIAMIFQEPMTSLNPCFTIGFQIMEALKIHSKGSRSLRRQRAIHLLEQVGIPAAKERLHSFPHQLSGGMNQRVMIAMAVACSPRLLIADEPTTALDVTIQAQILDLLLNLQKEKQMALILITHDMGVVAETAERVVVMYAGQIVESNSVENIFTNPRHPYTAALLNALPERSTGQRRLPTIPGTVPGRFDYIEGCLFNPRCSFARKECRLEHPFLTVTGTGAYRCHFPLENRGV